MSEKEKGKGPTRKANNSSAPTTKKKPEGSVAQERQVVKESAHTYPTAIVYDFTSRPDEYMAFQTVKLASGAHEVRIFQNDRLDIVLRFKESDFDGLAEAMADPVEEGADANP